MKRRSFELRRALRVLPLPSAERILRETFWIPLTRAVDARSSERDNAAGLGERALLGWLPGASRCATRA